MYKSIKLSIHLFIHSSTSSHKHVQLLTLSQTSPSCTCHLKTLWEKEKLLVTSNFSFFHNVFWASGDLSAISHQIYKCRLQTLSVWKSLKFVVWERFKFLLTLPHGNLKTRQKSKAFADEKLDLAQTLEQVSIEYWGKKKHWGKRKRYWLPAFPLFTTTISKVFSPKVYKIPD